MLLKPLLLCVLLLVVFSLPARGQTVRVRLDDREYEVDLGFRAIGGPVMPPSDVGPLTANRRQEGGADAVVLTWSAVANATRYVIHRGTPLQDHRYLATISAVTAALPGGSVGFVDRGLVSNETYQYRVRALNDLDVSRWSLPIHVAPLEKVTPLPAVTDRPLVTDCVGAGGGSVVGLDVAPGDRIRVIGSSLGSFGRLTLAGLLVPVLSWSDTEIAFMVPVTMRPTLRPVSLKLQRDGGGYYMSAPFRIGAGP